MLLVNYCGKMRCSSYIGVELLHGYRKGTETDGSRQFFVLSLESAATSFLQKQEHHSNSKMVRSEK